MSQEDQVKKYEVKILKQIKYLPIVFMLKHNNGQVIKISLISDNFVNCSKYISRSGMTFNGCFRSNEGQLTETKGIYYTPAVSLLSIYGRKKITRDLEKMKNLILKVLVDYNLTEQKLFIVYDNYNIEFFDIFIKGQLYQFNLTFNQGNLEIYEVPPINSKLNLNFDYKSNITIYNHQIEFSSPTLMLDLHSVPGIAYLIHLQNITTIALKSPEHGENTVMLSPNKYYLIVHPKPRSHKAD